jgi:hypothetical protein
MKRSSGTVLAATSLASTTATSIDVTDVDRVSVQVVYSDTAPAVKTFADGNVTVVGDIIAIAAHPYVTGCKVALTTDGVLPTGLSATNYYVINVSSGTIKLASSLANAVAGTAVDITAAAGGGTHTLTAATSTSNVCKLQESNDNSNWTDVGSYTVTIATTAGAVVWPMGEVSSRYLRVLYTPSAGIISLAIHASYVS